MGSSEVKVAKKRTLLLHRYVLHDLEVTDKQGNTSVGTYILYSSKPINLPELFKLKKDETASLDGKTLTDKLLSNEVALRAICWVDLNVFKSKGADLKKAVMSEGKIVEEISISPSKQMLVLHQALKNSGPKGVTITYEGPVRKREKDYISKLDTVPAKTEPNKFSGKKVA